MKAFWELVEEALWNKPQIGFEELGEMCWNHFVSSIRPFLQTCPPLHLPSMRDIPLIIAIMFFSFAETVELRWVLLFSSSSGYFELQRVITLGSRSEICVCHCTSVYCCNWGRETLGSVQFYLRVWFHLTKITSEAEKKRHIKCFGIQNLSRSWNMMPSAFWNCSTESFNKLASLFSFVLVRTYLTLIVSFSDRKRKERSISESL